MLNYRLGKRPAKVDPKGVRLKTILRALPPLPESYIVDLDLPHQIPVPMFANDRYGDCVIAGRAHQTLRYECVEQHQCVEITDTEVLEQYWSEGCFLHRWFPWIKVDRGLVLLDSLRSWQRDGWKIGSNIYNIYAFAKIDQLDHTEVKAAVYLLSGNNVGIQVPNSIWGQMDRNEPWDIIPGAMIEGGHCVLINGYNPQGPIAVTWGKFQQMTWAFWDKYCDEAYAIVDNRDDWLEHSPIDVEKLDSILDEITK